MDSTRPERFAFGVFVLDTSRCELSRSGVRLALRPKAFDVLVHLLTHRDRVLSKQDLFESLWPSQVVGDATLTSCIKEIRRALGDNGTDQRVIQTVHGRGYRFVLDVESAGPAATASRLDDAGADVGERRLAAILYAEIAGDARASCDSGDAGHDRARLVLARTIDAIDSNQGRGARLPGDAVLGEFRAASDALACAISIQSALRTENDALHATQRVTLRIGIHLGEVVAQGDEIHGDGVSMAAQFEALAEPGGVCVCEAVRTAAAGSTTVGYELLDALRLTNVAQPVRAYRVLSGQEHQRPPCPYPGMVAFRTEDASHFYGREVEIEQMVGLLRHQRFMLVIGPSGSGKSSLVRAGLLPALEHSRYDRDQKWLVRRIRPGPRPSAVLARALARKSPADVLLPDVVDELLAAHPPARRLLLLLDQFEETFTQAAREDVGRFIGMLQQLRTRSNLAMVITLRADFYPDLMNSSVWPVDASQRVEVAPLRGEALREAITRPAEAVGVHIEGGLLQRLLADAAEEPGVLPLLQETMRLLWPEMEGRELRLAAYERLSQDSATRPGSARSSGLAAAMALKADATLAALGETGQVIARRTFLRLVQFGEGRADTRRQQPYSALRAADDDEALFERTLEHLTDNRLLTCARGDVPDDAVVDIAHELLITAWARLRAWVDERREAEQARRRLEDKAAEWARLGAGAGGVLDEAELPEAERWLAGADVQDLGYSERVVAFVKASQRALEAVERERDAMHVRELTQARAHAEEQRRHASEQARAARRYRRLATLLSCVFMFALAMSSIALWQARLANSAASREEAARFEADARRAEAQAARHEAERQRLYTVGQLMLIRAQRQNASNLHERRLLLARQGWIFSRTGGRASERESLADRAVRAILRTPRMSVSLPRSQEHGASHALVVSADGDTLVGVRAPQIYVWNRKRPWDPPDVLVEGPQGRIHAMVLVRDGRSLVAGTIAGEIWRWDLLSPGGAPEHLGTIEGGIWSLAGTSDGLHLAIGGRGSGYVGLWRLDGVGAVPIALIPRDPGAPKLASTQAGGVGVAFDPSGRLLVSGALDGVVRVWRVDEPDRSPIALRGHERRIDAVAVGPDGRTIVSGDAQGFVRVWDLLRPDTSLHALRAHEEPITSLDISPDGRAFVSTSLDDTVGIWDLADVSAEAVTLHEAELQMVRFTPDGSRVVTAGHGGVKLWDLRDSGQPVTFRAHEGPVLGLGFAADGRSLISRGHSAVLRWDLTDLDAEPIEIAVPVGQVASSQFSADGRYLASRSQDRSVRIWRMHEDAPPATLDGHGGGVRVLAFSPDGKLLASGTEGGHVNLWDMEHRVNTASLAELADGICDNVWRNLTLEEWREFVGTDIPYEQTCPGFPAHPSTTGGGAGADREVDRPG